MNLIHVGLPKAASTSLQDNLFARQDRYAYFGKVRNRYVSAGVGELLGRISYHDSLDYDEHGAEALLQVLRAEHVVGERPILVSDEQLSVEGDADRRLIIERLHKLLAPAKVLIVIRSQPALCQSMYLHFIRSSGERIISFADWLDRFYGRLQFPNHRIGLDYNRLVTAYETVFGHDNVVMLPFELMRDDSPLVPETLAALLGATASWVAASLRGSSENVRQSTRHQFAIHMQNRLPVGTNLAVLGRKLLPAALYQPIRDFVTAGRRVPVPEMSEHWRARLAEACGRGNSKLEERSGLPLRALGYPIAC